MGCLSFLPPPLLLLLLLLVVAAFGQRAAVARGGRVRSSPDAPFLPTGLSLLHFLQRQPLQPVLCTCTVD